MGINLEVKFVGDKVVDLPDSCSCGPGTGKTAFIIIYYELSYPCCCLIVHSNVSQKHQHRR